MSLSSRGWCAAAAVLATCLVLLSAAAAQAAGPHEPDDGPEAAGPLGPAAQAAVETAADEDWYAFFVPEGDQDVALELTPLRAGDALCLRLAVEDDDGLVAEVASVRAAAGAAGSGALAYVVPGPARVLAAVDGCTDALAAPAPYRLSLAGDWPAADPRPAAGLPLDGAPDAAARAGAARCHAAATALRAAARRQRAARRAVRRHPGRAARRRAAAARRARDVAVRRVVRRC